MPAVTVKNPLDLPKVLPPSQLARPRRVTSITTAPRGLEGEGFPVRRAFAGVDVAALDPFVHMDQMGEIDYGPGEPKGTPWHPHRGFETVTYMMEGTFLHQDSIGGGGVIQDGATQWMTAGAGILHIERPPDAGLRGPHLGGPADSRTRGRLRPLRHEHPRGTTAGLRGLPGGASRADPGRPHLAVQRYRVAR